MPSRFGQLDANGLIDYHWDASTNSYDSDYVHPGSFPVNFFGCQTQEDANAATPALTYTWQEMNGNTVVGNLRDGLPNACNFAYSNWTSQGTHNVRLTVTDANGNLVPPTQSTSPFSQTVTIRDYLIVSIGDSYASGEGNPDKPQQVDLIPSAYGLIFTDLRSPARWEDERCHRSSYAGAAQAALALELESPKTSVIFISLACSGATISTPTFEDDNPAKPQGTGILGKYRGAAPGSGVGYTEAEFLPAQLEALHNLVGDRQIDALIISGGGNDIGFGNIAALCVVNARCYTKKVNDNFIPDDEGHPLSVVVSERITALAGKYDALAEAIHSSTSPWRLNVANVLLTEYADPTKGDNADYCFRILHDIAFWPLDMSWL